MFESFECPDTETGTSTAVRGMPEVTQAMLTWSAAKSETTNQLETQASLNSVDQTGSYRYRCVQKFGRNITPGVRVPHRYMTIGASGRVTASISRSI